MNKDTQEELENGFYLFLNDKYPSLIPLFNLINRDIGLMMDIMETYERQSITFPEKSMAKTLMERSVLMYKAIKLGKPFQELKKEFPDIISHDMWYVKNVLRKAYKQATQENDNKNKDKYKLVKLIKTEEDKTTDEK